jgi:hypothetical protein
MSDFSINGKTLGKDGKWGAEITLSTPDGRETTTSSGYKLDTEEEARLVMESRINELLEDLKEDGVEIVSDVRSTLQ